MGFAEIVGQGRILTYLRASLRSGRLHHAYLFLGPEGVGKRTAALALARAIHCEECRDDYCGRCVNCLRISDGNHPDLRLIEPLPDKKEITIKQVRELEAELSYRSFTGKRKIAVIDPATLMNTAAQNALLKTLEEPPQDSLIILIASHAGGLLPTVRSRCLRLAFAPVSRGEVAEFLKSQRAVKGEDAEFLAAMSMGSIGAATKMNKEELVEKRRRWWEMLGALKDRGYPSAMAAAETLSADRVETLEFLRWAETWYRDRLVHALTGDAEPLVNPDLIEQSEKPSWEDDPDRLLSLISEIGRAGARIQRNLNRRMVLERLLFRAVETRS
ncbi:MAG TPA: DNA polymerase III subunit delta' [Candidatus Binatia bacterium]|nr:DNA polymerase III subunit delta' [Candidatus Binatia bacterium]